MNTIGCLNLGKACGHEVHSLLEHIPTAQHNGHCNDCLLIGRKHLHQRINVWTTVPRLLHTVHQNDTMRKERRRELRRPRCLLSHRLDAQLNCVKKVRSNFGEVVPVLPHSV